MQLLTKFQRLYPCFRECTTQLSTCNITGSCFQLQIQDGGRQTGYTFILSRNDTTVVTNTVQFQKLERAQNDAIRVVTAGQLRTTPVEALHCEAKIPTYKTWSDRRCLIALISSNYSSGSAAIICSSHSVEAPQVLSRLTSSSTDQVTPLDAEVAAISLAMAWLQDQDCDPSCAILCDSKSVVEAVSKARLSSQEQSPAINSVRRFLSEHPQVILQLVRGQTGLTGNEAAHQAAFLLLNMPDCVSLQSRHAPH